MFKMTFTLAVALYSGFVIWGDPSDDLTTTVTTRDLAVAAAATEYAQPVIMDGAAQNGVAVTRAAVVDIVVPDAATIAASAPLPQAGTAGPRLIGEPVVVSLVQTAAPAATSTAAVQDEVDGLFKVSGTRVNMRSGPSTSNTVVDSLPGGTLAEIIGTEADGWVQIRDVASGQTGYMAARFLEPA